MTNGTPRWGLHALRGVSIFIAAAGAIGWFSGFLFQNTTLELPNTQLADVVVFQDGTITAADDFFERIQVFDANGRFLRGWSPTADGGIFCLDRVRDQLWSYAARGNILERYNIRGDLLSRGKFVQDFPIDCSIDPKIASIQAGYGGASVLFKNGKLVRLEQKWWHYILPGSFYSWLIFAIGLVLNPDWRRGIGRLLRSRFRTGGASTKNTK